MGTSKIKVPAKGEKISYKNGKLNIPDNPIIPFIEGDGIGVDITPVMKKVVDAAVDKAYGGTKAISWMEILLANSIITIITYLIDRVWFSTIEQTKSILYEKIDLIKPENEQNLIEDLKLRTGLNITSVKIDKVDFLRDTAQITIYYH